MWPLGTWVLGFLTKSGMPFSPGTLEKRATPCIPGRLHGLSRVIFDLVLHGFDVCCRLNKEPDNPALIASLLSRRGRQGVSALCDLQPAWGIGHIMSAGPVCASLLIPEAWEVVLNYLGIELERKDNSHLKSLDAT